MVRFRGSNVGRSEFVFVNESVLVLVCVWFPCLRSMSSTANISFPLKCDAIRSFARSFVCTLLVYSYLQTRWIQSGMSVIEWEAHTTANIFDLAYHIDQRLTTRTIHRCRPIIMCINITYFLLHSNVLYSIHEEWCLVVHSYLSSSGRHNLTDVQMLTIELESHAITKSRWSS